jgi:hypothetical protein
MIHVSFCSHVTTGGVGSGAAGVGTAGGAVAQADEITAMQNPKCLTLNDKRNNPEAVSLCILPFASGIGLNGQ